MELNFKENKVNVIDIETLKRTFKENDVNGKPLRGMYHYDLIENVANIVENHGLQMQIEEIFAAQSGDRNTPGVTIAQKVADEMGENAPEAHLLRRVYANINVRDYDNDEFTTHVAVAWHQKGIQVAFGPTVRICHNLCILGRGNMFSTGKDMTIERLLEKFSEAIGELGQNISVGMEKIAAMKRRIMTPQEILCTIGALNTIRVAHDTIDPEIRQKGMYPLNQTQLNKFTENLLKIQKHNDSITAWDLYNVGTALLKPDRSEIPTLFEQHIALTEYMDTLL